MDDDKIFDPPQPKLRIKACSMAAGADMGAVAATIERAEEEGFDLVTAYGVPTDGGRIAHFFVLRRRPERALAIEVAEGAAAIVAESGTPAAPTKPSNEGEKINTKPAGKDRRR